MWLAVIALGVFQTLLMIPFRIINLKLSANIEKFEEEVEKEKSETKQQFLLKEQVKKGDPNMLWYLVNFFTQTILYLSIGRLFLTDFYRKVLNPKLLYSFVPYPDYPIKDTFFKIPYLHATNSIDLGFGWVIVVWLIGLGLKIVKDKFIRFYRKQQLSGKAGEIKNPFMVSIKNFIKNISGYFTVFLVISWVLVRHFPTGWELRIFSGDVSIPNYTLNAITAIVATIMILWLNIPKISLKGQLALSANIPEKIVKKTQNEMFKETTRSAVVIGLGAYFITRFIPSAFELSIFTLEVISFLAPFTIDKLIFSQGKLSVNFSNIVNFGKADSSAQTSL